jgi:hypothetical protein
MKNIPIEPDTLNLGGELAGHKLVRRCDDNEKKLLVKVFGKHMNDLFDLLLTNEGSELWEYHTTGFLCGQLGYAVVLGDRVIAYNITGMS